MLTFYSKQNNKYYSTDSQKCNNCNKYITNGIQVITKINNIYKTFCYCFNCSDYIRSKHIIEQWRGINIVKQIPRDAVPVIDKLPGLRAVCLRNDIETINTKYEKDKPITIDNTRLAGRESYEGVKIGANVNEITETPLKLLDNLKNNIPIIDKQKTPIIEGKGVNSNDTRKKHNNN